MGLFGHKKKQENIPDGAQTTIARGGRAGFFFKALGYVAFFIALFFASFWKNNTPESPLYLNRPSGARLVSPIDFEYISDLKTKERKEQQRRRVVPVYKIDLSNFRDFSQKIEQLKHELAECDPAAGTQRNEKITTLIEMFDALGLKLERSDVERLLRFKNLQRNRLLDESLFILQEMVQKGVWDDDPLYGTLYFQTFDPISDPQQQRLTVGNALRLLRTRIFSTVSQYDVANALIHIMRYGLKPNFVCDQERTEERIRQVVEQTSNVTVHIAAGDVLVEFGQIVTAEVLERWQAYQNAIAQQTDYKTAQMHALLKDGSVFTLLWTLAMLLLLPFPTHLRSSVRLQSTTAAVILFQVLLIRTIAWFCDNSEIGQSLGWTPLVPFLVPTFLCAVLVTTLVDAFAGAVITLLTVGLKVLLLRGSFELFLCDLTVGWALVSLCRRIQFKKDVFKVIACGFLIYAVLIALHGYLYQPIDLVTGLQRTAAISVNGLFTFLFVFLFTPLLEKLFHHSTNMTFLRLTDFNHPLLRKLQEVAPGTYHHSLMVAALAEKAASEIGANALLCRCCALYHDVGKMKNPNYFTENQQGDNPHRDQPPSVSVMILKGHISEGVLLAKRYHLPRVIRDMMRQHHGTFLMQYFYKKALLIKAENETVDEAAFRYDGPKPQTKEAAILFLSDAVEASSRSLETPTETSIEALVKSIVKDREDDGQLNDSALTLKDLEIIRKTFSETLTTMLHRRISYNKIDVGNASASTQTATLPKESFVKQT